MQAFRDERDDIRPYRLRDHAHVSPAAALSGWLRAHAPIFGVTNGLIESLLARDWK
ncbi:hypothetical protein ACVWZM_001958 [Bradyrhizobium sp. USDA 4501]